MRRRVLPAFLALAGCASPVPPPSLAVPVATAAVAAAEMAVPAAAPSVAPPTASGDMIFDAWASEFQGRALAAGVRPDVLSREMAGLSPDPRVAGLDSRQPEFSKPVSDYLKGVV